MWVLNSFFCLGGGGGGGGVGNSPIKKIVQGICPGGWSGLELTYTYAIHGVQNYNKTEAKHIAAEAKVNHDTQFYKIKGRGGVPPPPQSPMTFEMVDEILSILLPA